jgi:hypothetical protein
MGEGSIRRRDAGRVIQLPTAFDKGNESAGVDVTGRPRHASGFRILG